MVVVAAGIVAEDTVAAERAAARKEAAAKVVRMVAARCIRNPRRSSDTLKSLFLRHSEGSGAVCRQMDS